MREDFNIAGRVFAEALDHEVLLFFAEESLEVLHVDLEGVCFFVCDGLLNRWMITSRIMYFFRA